MKDAAQTIKAHWDGILQCFTSQVNNAVLEGTNSLVQTAKGYTPDRDNVNRIVVDCQKSKTPLLGGGV